MRRRLAVVSFAGCLFASLAVACGGGDGQSRIGSWRATSALGAVRDGKCLVQLSDRRVLVIGGIDADVRTLRRDVSFPLWSHFLYDVSIYDVESGRWTQAAPTQFGHAFTDCFRLPSGKVVVVGHGFGPTNNRTGLGFGSSRIEIYDPALDRWDVEAVETRTLPGRTTVLLPDGRLLLVGGVVEGPDGFVEARSDAEIYDAENRTWEILPDLPRPSGFGVGAVLRDGRIEIIHDQVELFDPTTSTWAPTAPAGFAAVEVSSDGAFALVASHEGTNNGLRSVLDLRTLAISPLSAGDANAACSFGTAALADGRFLCGQLVPRVIDPRAGSGAYTGELSEISSSFTDEVDHVTLDDGRVLFVPSGDDTGLLFSPLQ